VVDQLVRYPNVYADTAGVRRAGQGAVRKRRPVTASGAGAAQDPPAGPRAGSAGRGDGRECAAADWARGRGADALRWLKLSQGAAI
jgi:hypothetical protein